MDRNEAGPALRPSAESPFLSHPKLHAALPASMLDPFRVRTGAGFSLAGRPTGGAAPAGLDKPAAKLLLQDGIAGLAERQERLYAGATWSLLVVIQAMDAGGKDSVIKHVMSSTLR